MIPSFTKERWFLILVDLVLIMAATVLSPWIRFGHHLEILSIHTGASVFTLILYMVMLYIFDLYNMARAFISRDTALRMAAVVVLTGIFSGFLFYSLPQWKYGRGIFLIQMAIV